MHSSPRRRPELNINTSASNALSSSNPKARDAVALPRPTRKLQSRSKSGVSSSSGNPALNKGPTSVRRHAEPSFLETHTPVDSDMSNKENDHPNTSRARDSHDLSMPVRQVTRDSLMANLVLSLDQLSFDPPTGHHTGHSVSTREEYNPYATAEDRAWSVATKRSRSNTYGTSYGPDVDADDASRLSSQTSRGRRSNSSSTFQPGLGRINSMRESTRIPRPGTPRGLHGRGEKGSKSSSINSIDPGHAQVMGSQRLTHGFGGRSSSFDHSLWQPDGNQTSWHLELSNSFLNEGYDAAPTPTVPGGPRRTAPSTPSKATFSIPEPPPHPKTPALERKRSTRSARGGSIGRKPESRFNSNRDPVQSAPTFELDSAPAPHVGYGKSKEPLHSGPTSTHAPSQTKDKPGFFRRVFGSSRTNLSSSHMMESHNSSSQFSSTSAENVEAPVSKTQHIASQMKAQSTPPSRDTSSSHSHNVLHKKPSSFFRRRKKSVSDYEAPPVPGPSSPPPLPPVTVPILLPPHNKRPPNPEPSPVSSLRRVMNPYLKGSPTTNGTPTPLQTPSPDGYLMTEADASHEQGIYHYKRDFSPDYDPSPNAVIRAVEQSHIDDPSSSDRDYQRRTDTPTRPPPDVPKAAERRNNSFLHLDLPGDKEANASSPSGPGHGSKDRVHRRASNGSHSQVPRPSPSQQDPNEDTLRPIKIKIRAAIERAKAEEAQRARLALPIEGARADSQGSVPGGTQGDHVRPEASRETGPISAPKPEGEDAEPLDEPEFVTGAPTDDDRQKALKIYEGNEDFIQKERAAAWMGEEGVVRQRTLKAYMELYDFKHVSIVDCLRQICGRLVFRAETQQVDRILIAFSDRWADCNPNHGFKSTDVVHTICYSIMLLNTDLHLADIEQKMTRGQFVKNTMTTIRHALVESAPEAFERPSILPGKTPMLSAEDGRPSVDPEGSGKRSSFLPTRQESSNSQNDTASYGNCGPLVNAPFDGSMRAWETQLEIVLKDIYASIRDERLPLYGAEQERYQAGGASQSSLSVMGMLKRSPSVLSKTPSESQASLRGRIAEGARASAGRWGSKSRSRPRFGTAGFSSSRTSFDDGNSMWSPAASSSATWSKYSLGRTQTSMSMDSFGSSWPRGGYQQSIGFANALSQAISREDLPGSASILSDELKATQLLEDESLELAGPPWVKEGMLIHKHHLDGADKKAKDRNWTEVFAVIQKGSMSLFSFTPNKSLRSKRSTRQNKSAAVPVGGGNWQENATSLGAFNLRQTLASALPPPGYSRTRPHVWALSLPTGAVHLFQAGTPEIIKEFVTTANYWSARLSTHPLMGGISNIDYGWSDAIVNNALVSAINESAASPHAPGGRSSRPGSSAAVGPGTRRSSIQSGSYRSGSLDHGLNSPGNGGRTKLPGDRIHIAEWTPPTQSMRPSNLGEHDQLENLLAYVKGIEEDLQAHNQLRSPMLLAFTPRAHNATKAMANWERKSAYLLREIVKFRTYVDCLQQAETRKQEIYAEKELAKTTAKGDMDDEDPDETIRVDEGDVTIKP